MDKDELGKLESISTRMLGCNELKIQNVSARYAKVIFIDAYVTGNIDAYTSVNILSINVRLKHYCLV
ncbi:MAG: hypothetical protein QXU32_02175 [Nitrososphaerales archaeon]